MLRDCTVVCVAHRIETIADYDQILVLDDGEVAEFGAPSELLAKEGSLFGALLAESDASSGA